TGAQGRFRKSWGEPHRNPHDEREIVFTLVTDPVGASFVDSLARPGGNASGPARLVALWQSRMPNKTTPPPSICQGPSVSRKRTQAPHAATTGCTSKVTDEVNAGKYLIANTRRPCPPAWVRSASASSVAQPVPVLGAKLSPIASVAGRRKQAHDSVVT